MRWKKASVNFRHVKVGSMSLDLDCGNWSLETPGTSLPRDARPMQLSRGHEACISWARLWAREKEGLGGRKAGLTIWSCGLWAILPLATRVGLGTWPSSSMKWGQYAPPTVMRFKGEDLHELYKPLKARDSLNPPKCTDHHGVPWARATCSSCPVTREVDLGLKNLKHASLDNSLTFY
jgi:hypothetical protein